MTLTFKTKNFDIIYPNDIDNSDNLDKYFIYISIDINNDKNKKPICELYKWPNDDCINVVVNIKSNVNILRHKVNKKIVMNVNKTIQYNIKKPAKWKNYSDRAQEHVIIQLHNMKQNLLFS